MSQPIPHLPFAHYLTYAELTEYVQALADSRPDLCRLRSLGTSREGRTLHLLCVTDFGGPRPEERPAYLIHGNIHASELAGTHAALYTARRLLADAPDLLRQVVFYIVPRINPDGAEYAVTTCGRIRSRTEVCEREPNCLYPEDLDGDGLILTVRQQHPDGAFVADPQDPRLLVERRFDSPPPYYRVLPEGLVHDWDGSDAIRTGGRSLDWNRNWSYDWRPEPEQGGAGDFPFSEPEMRLLGAFLHDHPNLFGVLGYHTGPGAVLRPPSTGADTDLDAADVRLMEDLARIGSRETGLPVIPVVKYHDDRSRDIELRGHFHNFGYQHLGLFVFEFELGIVHNSAGIATPEQFAATEPEARQAQMRQVLAWWDQQRFDRPLCVPWTPFVHPQLGPVEIGGVNFTLLANPAIASLEDVAAGTYRFTLEHARRHPQVCTTDVHVEGVAPSCWRVRARIANRGDLPTHVTQRGRGLARLRPVRVHFRPAPGARLLSYQGTCDLGHLAKVPAARLVEWFVAAEGGRLGTIEVRAGAGGSHDVDVTGQ